MARTGLIEAGILRAFLPPVHGGTEMRPVHGIRLFEELAAIAGFTAAGPWLAPKAGVCVAT